MTHKTRKNIKKRDYNLLYFLTLSAVFGLLVIIALNLSKYTEYDIIRSQEMQVVDTAPEDTEIDIATLTPREQITAFADDYGILPRLLRFTQTVSFTEVSMPVNFDKTDLYFTNFSLTRFLTSLDWKQVSGLETPNQDRQTLTFTTPTDETFRIRIFYAPKGVYPASKPQIAIIVKGFGSLSADELARWLTLHKNICFSVLPINQTSRQNMQSIVDRNLEALIELPMEAPGFPSILTPEYAIFGQFNDNEVTAKLNSYFRLLPHPSGVITHLGGLITTDHRIMPIILRYIKDQNLYFIDDNSIETSIAHQVASQLLITSYEKPLNLRPADFRDDKSGLQLSKVIRDINREKTIITLQRPDNETYELVQRLVKVATENNFEIVRVKDL